MVQAAEPAARAGDKLQIACVQVAARSAVTAQGNIAQLARWWVLAKFERYREGARGSRGRRGPARTPTTSDGCRVAAKAESGRSPIRP